jgi:hypothetical protein
LGGFRVRTLLSRSVIVRRLAEKLAGIRPSLDMCLPTRLCYERRLADHSGEVRSFRRPLDEKCLLAPGLHTSEYVQRDPMLIEADGAYTPGSRGSAFLISGSCHWDETVTRWSRREFIFSAIRFVAVSRPSFAHGYHNDQGGNQNLSSPPVHKASQSAVRA